MEANVDIECEGGKIERNESACDDRGMIRQPLLSKNRVNTSSQIAIVGSNVCPIESLDYEILENDLFKQDWRSRKKVQILQYITLKWTLALLIGVSTGLVGFFNNLAVENIAGFKFLLTSKLMLQQKYYQAFLAFAGINLVLATCASVLCAYIAPAAAGSGIPEVKAYLNGIDAHSILAPSTLFVKIFGSILGVAAGFVVGKEGPMVHTGACIANLLGQGGSRKYHLTWKWLRYFKNDRDRRDLITCGAAAGVAAAFRAPVGGVLFALEEVASWWRSALLWRTFFTTAVVAVVLRSLIEYCRSGYCGLFGEGGLIMFDINSSIPDYNVVDLLAVTLIGVIGGILGSLYNYLVDKVLRTYSMINEKGPTFRVFLVIVISLLTSCCAYGIPWFRECVPCPVGLEVECPAVGRSGSYKYFQCPPGHYNDLASLILNTNDDAIRSLFSSLNADEFRITTLLVFFILMYALGIITYGIAIPSGLFIPVILAGASYGRLVGSLLVSFSNLNVGLFALLGAASFLGGTMRMTVSLCVILLELTNNLLMLPLMMLVLLISKSVADNFNKGVYDQIVKMKGLPFLEAHAEPYLRQLVAGDVVSGPLISFSGVEKVSNIVHSLRLTSHNGFPVIDEPPFLDAPELCGVVLRSHLIVLLKGKMFTKDRRLTGTEMLQRYRASDFAKAGLGKGPKLEDLDIKPEDMDMYVDLHPITNTSPYTVIESMSLAKAAVAFRELGLRHLCVVPKTPGRPPIVGILTRHDFMPEHILGLYPGIDKQK
ncbi:putative CBS domain, chloride channel, voltage gated, chloride channel, core [Helianthus annuus]|uniref:Chloride channel protein n=1 Tax=Helianthus annuus TaxID=4232 RepID=A0A251ULV7_HELAN|nr:chloride channel protein CLC-c [Helianthus annuus]KAF5803317.1 putative chloride channel, voltage gated, chloride channel, core [Helianthus annuus]KAJ0561294.1 putative CBS domain, chloride channel, voltage gated, chloride channel, core [Helianthus annuus]KAJ0574349.1 putative CBS domain, chloride channel, voltage gated, chloride channel, core [Helianthus annuus]KAJ0738685.1 putative CBS domain, chloride channel, voltage gated, chloride channel, core [Helianthus annuus]KAJ0741570.1 putative